MNNIKFNSVDLSLKASQIVCLEHQANSLYGEVIQLIPHRQRCWFRPLCLVVSFDLESNLESNFIWRLSDSQNLRSPDLNKNQQKYSDAPLLALDEHTERTKLIDLQSSSDLLWPDSLFRPALDTEIIHLLPQLKDISNYPEDKKSKQNCLNQFVHLVWQAHQDKF